MLMELLRRIRAAGRILLRGDRAMPVTWHDFARMEAEWSEWQITFTGILEKLNAWQARMAKREKRMLEAEGALLGGDEQDASSSATPRGIGRKADIYRRAVGGHHTAPIGLVRGGEPPPAPPSPDPGEDD